jgi:hypothetical protein
MRASTSRPQRGIGQPGRRILLGMAGDRAGLRHGGGQAVLAQVGGAGAALALAEVDGHRHPAVAGGLHCLHFAQAHVDRKTGVLVTGDFALVGAGGAGAVQQLAGDGGQLFQPLPAVVGGRRKIGGRVQ